MKKIDCLGEICPVPMLLLQEEYDAILAGTPVMLVTDHHCTLESVERYCEAYDLAYLPEEVIKGVWEITIKKETE